MIEIEHLGDYEYKVYDGKNVYYMDINQLMQFLKQVEEKDEQE